MLKFLKKQAKSTHEKVSNVAASLLICAVWTILISIFYEWLFATNYPIFNFGSIYKHPFAVEFFLVCLLAPLWEEAVFRHFPLQLVKASKKEELFIPTILFTSIIFGLLHYGPVSILIQGFLGFIASCLYIKNGYSYWSAFALHFLWNTSLTFGVLIV